MTAETLKKNEYQPDQYLRPSEAASYVSISESTLAKLRMRSSRFSGPNWIKAAGCVIYRTSDLDSWLMSHLVDDRQL